MKPTLKSITFIAILPGDSGSDFLVFIREVQVKISKQFQNDSLLCLDTITALGLQYVYVRKAGRFIGDFASEIIECREHYIRRNGSELSWEFLDKLSSVVAPCNIRILTFLKSHHCSFNDSSKYDSWKASTGKCNTSGGKRHCDILSKSIGHEFHPY